MEQPIVRKLITTKCELLVSPFEEIEPASQYVYLEFMTKKGDNIDSYESACISQNPIIYKFKIDEDGLYFYNRLKLGTKSFFGDIDANTVYYDEELGEVFIGSKKIETSTQLNDLVDNIKTENRIFEVVAEPIFSICRLEYCLAEKQRKFLFAISKDYKIENCEESKSDKFLRDFLFTSLFVLRQLIRQQRYDEASRILVTLTRCNGLCVDTISSKSCNCCK